MLINTGTTFVQDHKRPLILRACWLNENELLGGTMIKEVLNGLDTRFLTVMFAILRDMDVKSNPLLAITSVEILSLISIGFLNSFC